MEDRLKDVLLDGEVVRWSGRPVPFKLMNLPSRKSMILTWVLSVLALVLVLSLLLPFYIRTQRSAIDIIVLLIIAGFLPAMFSTRPLLDKRCLEHSTIYAITNLRILALVRDDLMYLPLKNKMKTAIEETDGDCGNLCFCDAIGLNSRKSLERAVVGVQDGNTSRARVPGLLFYHVSQPEQLLRFLP